MSNPVNDLIAGLQELVGQVPELVQPIIVAVAGSIPFIEGEVSAMIGVLGGLHPLVAASAGAIGNLTSVVLVVLLSSRIRAAAIARRSRSAPVPAAILVGATNSESATPGSIAIKEADPAPAQAKPESKGRQRVRRWLIRFGLPGASILGPLAIPTQFTAAIFAASGISKGKVIVWQAVAIVLWTAFATTSATIASMLFGYST